jgi:hypothetical protein
MQQIKSFGDRRTLDFCALCSVDYPETRDHCPSKILLEEPYTENLPVVPVCEKCNVSISLDEEYFACLLSCVMAGSTNPELIERSKIKRILNSKPVLQARIEQSRFTSKCVPHFTPEPERVEAVLLKLARGHSLYELHEICMENPSVIWYADLESLKSDVRNDFENLPPVTFFPEIGSRAMQRIVEANPMEHQWVEVQANRYRFAALALPDGIEVRIVIQDYLACLINWRFNA